MTTTSAIAAPTQTIPPSVPAPEETGGVWKGIAQCGTALFHLAYRVGEAAFHVLKCGLEMIAGLVTQGATAVYTWFIGAASAPSAAAPESARGQTAEDERRAVEEAVRAADIDEQILGRVARAPAPAVANPLAAAAAGLTEEEQLQMMQAADADGVRAPIQPRFDVLNPGAPAPAMTEEQQYEALQMQQLHEERQDLLRRLQRENDEAAQRARQGVAESAARGRAYAAVNDEATRRAQRVEGLMSQSRQEVAESSAARGRAYAQAAPSTTHVPPAPATTAPQRPEVPEDLRPLMEQNRDGIAYLKQKFPTLTLNVGPDNEDLYEQVAKAVVQDYIDPSKTPPTAVPAFLNQQVRPEVTIKDRLDSLRRQASVQGQNNLVNFLVNNVHFQACVWGAFMS